MTGTENDAAAETSALVAGHSLLHEGAPFMRTYEGSRMFLVGLSRGHGLCSCGATSEIEPSTAARKRWHRQHKAGVLAGVQS